MIIEIKIPSPGESVAEVEIANWLVNDGDFVEKDQEIAEIESDKATLPLIAEESGIISIKAETGKAVSVGSVACTIDSEGKSPVTDGKETQPDKEKHPDRDKDQGTEKSPVREKNQATEKNPDGEKDKENEVSTEAGIEKGNNNHAGSRTSDESEKAKTDKMSGDNTDKVKVSPLAKKLMDDEGLNVEDIIHGLRRITKEDVAFVAGMKKGSSYAEDTSRQTNRHEERKRMSMLRRNLSKRLVEVKNQTAMLTTFNEVDMSNIINIRKKYQSAFTEKHGIKLGFMSFFTKAVTAVLNIYPDVNSYIDGEDVVTPGYFDIGIAVQTEKGLMVPVIRNTETLSLADIEQKIIELAEKARKNRISIEDMTGGTFTITNGGIFGSLLSTPILNPPQSGILGMHNIVERPVAIDGKVEIRPMMYIALSYDHRIIDGRDSVGFLVKAKEILEDPVRLLFGGSDPGNRLLDL